MKLTRLRRSLPMQMALNFAVMILITAVAVGLPATWLIGDQLDRQAGALLNQGSAAAETFYLARQNEALNLALITAQRPTLRRLVSQNDREALPPYLTTLQSGANLDLLLVCDPNGRSLAQAGQPVDDSFCGVEAVTFHIEPTSPIQAWLLAAEPIFPETEQLGKVIVGWRLNEPFLQQTAQQLELAQTLLLHDAVLATSLPASTAVVQNGLPVERPLPDRYRFSLDQRRYYAQQVALNDEGLATVVTLDITNIVDSQRRLIWTMLGGILLVALLGSVLALFLARRIGRPLNDLATAAGALSWRDLDRPIRVESEIAEVSQVARALDFARLELRGALTDLRQERDWINHLLDSIVEGTMTLDADGRITFFSQGAERITGWPRQEAIGLRADDLLQMVDTRAPFSQFIPATGQKERLAVQMADGRQLILAMTVAQLAPPAAGNAEVALVFRDVTEEEALRRLLGHFLANVAHEFRTPLSALAASIELLLDEAPDLSHEEFEELLNALHLGILGLQTLVDNLLESASIESGRFRIAPRPTDLRQIIAEAAQTMTPLIHKHGQCLRLDLPDEPISVSVDGRRLAQVIVNLLSNAVKFGPDEAEIVLTATVTAERVKIMVADEGPGVPPEQRDDLFRWFLRRQPDESRPPFGIGLGLAVVKAVVLAHNGRVGIEDRPGGGSIFWFDLGVVSSQ
jgi:PAS domain S-box-containing protein